MQQLLTLKCVFERSVCQFWRTRAKEEVPISKAIQLDAPFLGHLVLWPPFQRNPPAALYREAPLSLTPQADLGRGVLGGKAIPFEAEGCDSKRKSVDNAILLCK